MRMPLRSILLVALLGPASAIPLFAALSNPDREDIDYITEHLPESAMDARFLALPWPAGRLEAGRWQTTVEAGWPLGRRFAIAPRAIAVWPLPPGGFSGRLTGPGFDLEAQDGGGLKIGDGFAGLGLELLDRPTGLGIDLGGTLYFAGAEGIVHAGVNRALTVQIAWHR